MNFSLNNRRKVAIENLLFVLLSAWKKINIRMIRLLIKSWNAVRQRGKTRLQLKAMEAWFKTVYTHLPTNVTSVTVGIITYVSRTPDALNCLVNIASIAAARYRRVEDNDFLLYLLLLLMLSENIWADFPNAYVEGLVSGQRKMLLIIWNVQGCI